MAIYSRIAGPILREKLEALAALPPDERHCLGEEVDLARVMAEKALRLWEAAHTNGNEEKASPETKALANKALRDALSFVSDLVVKASKVRSTNESTVDVEQLDYIVKQVTHVIEEEIADHDRGMADRVVERLRNIRMPDRSGGGSMSPAELAQALRDGADAIMDGIHADEPEEEGDDE